MTRDVCIHLLQPYLILVAIQDPQILNVFNHLLLLPSKGAVAIQAPMIQAVRSLLLHLLNVPIVIQDPQIQDVRGQFLRLRPYILLAMQVLQIQDVPLHIHLQLDLHLLNVSMVQKIPDVHHQGLKLLISLLVSQNLQCVFQEPQILGATNVLLHQPLQAQVATLGPQIQDVLVPAHLQPLNAQVATLDPLTLDVLVPPLHQTRHTQVATLGPLIQDVLVPLLH